VYPSDLKTLKLNYLSPLWMDQVSNYFNLNYNRSSLLTEQFCYTDLDQTRTLLRLNSLNFNVDNSNLSDLLSLTRETTGNYTD
jgi:hypothetical protein